MSYLYCSSPDGRVGGLGFSRYLDSFDDIPASEFYDVVDDSMLLCLPFLLMKWR